MKNLFKKPMLLLLISVVFQGCKENKLEQSITSKKLRGNFTVTKVTDSRRIMNYDHNLDIAKGESYYNLSNNEIKIVTPVPNKNFKVKNVYYYNEELFSVIMVHISDGTVETARNKPKDYILEGALKFKDMAKVYPGRVGFEGGPKGVVYVVVLNDDGTFSFKKRPRESGGGVIVEGP